MPLRLLLYSTAEFSKEPPIFVLIPCPHRPRRRSIRRRSLRCKKSRRGCPRAPQSVTKRTVLTLCKKSLCFKVFDRLVPESSDSMW